MEDAAEPADATDVPVPQEPVETAGSSHPPLPHVGWRSLISPTSIYGTIIVSAVMIVADDQESDLRLMFVTLGTIVMVWVAEVFSEVVAGHRATANPPEPFRAVLRASIRESLGLLASAVLPLALLLVGALHILDEYLAYYLALLVTVAFLGVVGWFAFGRRGYAWPGRLGGALLTALLGAIVVLLKSIVH